MALTYKATFRPERRKYKETGELIEENVPLMLDLSFQGRCWYNTGIKLKHINDFNVKTQKMESGKKAIENKDELSATKVSARLDSLKGYISQAFNDAKALNIQITAKYLIEQMRIKSGNMKVEVAKEDTFLDDFTATYENWYKKNMIGLERYKHYKVTEGILSRFLQIKKLTNITSKEFTSNILLSFQDFLINEYTYIERYPEIYDKLSVKQIPKERSKNTVASKLTGLKTFFNELEEKDVIASNPFRKIAKRERVSMLKESYDEPVYLNIEELLTIVNNDCPEHLDRVRDCFLLQCAIGSRIDDFNSLTWSNISQKDSFYYIHYVPSKTSHRKDLKAIDTPLVKFAYDIVMKYKDALPDKLLAPFFIGNISGINGYNKQIKLLLTHYGINRSIITRGNDGKLNPVSISSLASSKICRKTHVDILAKVALNKYSSGLHEEGSKAVDRYTGLSIEEKYKLYCMAFKQDEYICQ